MMTVPDTCDDGNRELTILVAEDNEINQKVVERILQTAGYSMDLVDNGRQAAEFACQIRYDLILMDIQMPLMDGYEAAIAIRNAEKFRGQRTEDGGQRTEDGKRKTEDRGQRTEDRGQMSEYRGQTSEDGGQYKTGENSDSNSAFPIPPSPFKEVPIVAMTGNAVEAEIEKCRELGINDCIGKPLSPGQLLAMIKKWTGTESVSPAAGQAQKDASRLQPEESCAHQPVDLARALREFMGEKEVLSDLLQLFTGNVRIQIKAIRQAMFRQDYKVVAKEAHSIKGAAGNLTAGKMVLVAADLEKAADSGQAEPLRHLVDMLEERLQQLETYLQDKMVLFTE